MKKIQIINLIPMEYPYQVTRMRKQMPHVILEYCTKENLVPLMSDLYILIIKDVDETLPVWLSESQIDKSKVILIVPQLHDDMICWCMPKAFEKEFDVEKLMTFLACILEQRPELNLLQSLEIKSGRMQKEGSLKKCVDHAIKGIGVKEKAEVHFLIREKTRHLMEKEDVHSNLSVFQYWVRGVDAEMDYLVIKRKS